MILCNVQVYRRGTVWPAVCQVSNVRELGQDNQYLLYKSMTVGFHSHSDILPPLKPRDALVYGFLLTILAGYLCDTSCKYQKDSCCNVYKISGALHVASA